MGVTVVNLLKNVLFFNGKFHLIEIYNRFAYLGSAYTNLMLGYMGNHWCIMQQHVQLPHAGRLMQNLKVVYQVFSLLIDFVKRRVVIPVNSCTLSPNWDILVTASDDGILIVWNVESGKILCRLVGHSGPVNCCKFSTNGSTMASASYDKTIKIWNISIPVCLRTLAEHNKSVESIAFSTDSNYLCSTSWDKQVIIWNVETGDLLKKLSGHTECVKSCCFSYCGKMLATGGWDNTVIVWNIQGLLNKDIILKESYELENVHINSCKQLRLNSHTGNVCCLSFARIGLLASGSWDNSICLWNPLKGTLIKRLTGHTGWVKCVAFSIDSVEMASAAEDDTVRVWHIPTLQCVNELKGKTDLVNTCNFSPSGTLVTAGAGDMAIKVTKESMAHETL